MQNKVSEKSKKYLLNILDNYSKIGVNENKGIDRVALTQEDKQGRDYFIELLKENNFDVKIDNIGNIFGLINFDNSHSYILSGSHIDSQPNGGNYDGIFGVINAFVAVKEIAENVKKK